MRVIVWTGLLPLRAQSRSLHRSLCTLAASTILAVASARILAALNSLREFSRSLSPSASALMALTKSEVAWARMRACRTISPEGTGHNQVRTLPCAGQWCRQGKNEAFCDHKEIGEKFLRDFLGVILFLDLGSWRETNFPVGFDGRENSLQWAFSANRMRHVL